MLKQLVLPLIAVLLKYVDMQNFKYRILYLRTLTRLRFIILRILTPQTDHISLYLMTGLAVS